VRDALVGEVQLDVAGQRLALLGRQRAAAHHLAARGQSREVGLQRFLVALAAVHRLQARVEVDVDVRHGASPSGRVRRAA
jgi:hypothetical protein